MRAIPVAVGLAAVALAGTLAACGGSDAPREPEPPRRPETTDPAAQLPRGWTRLINRRAGFSVGIPPGWKPRGVRGTTLVRSGDRLLAVSISADRSSNGRALRPTVYAERLVKALPGYRRLRTGRPVSVRAHYPGASVTARGTFTRTHVRQAIRAVALQRPDQVTYALVFFRRARSPAALYRPAINGMIRTFRARAPGSRSRR